MPGSSRFKVTTPEMSSKFPDSLYRYVRDLFYVHTCMFVEPIYIIICALLRGAI